MKEARSLYLLAKGMTLPKIADILGVSTRTIEAHLENLKFKAQYFRPSIFNKIYFSIRNI